MEEKDIESALKKLLVKITGTCESEISALAQSGSDRRYFRLSAGGRTFIGTYVPDPVEGECFVRLARGLRNSGKCVPEVYIASPDYKLYVQEDLGDLSLFSALGRANAGHLVKETLRRLVDLQKTPEEVWGPICMALPFSRRQAMWDLNYFKYEFLKIQQVLFDEERLEDDFEKLSQRLASIPEEYLGFMMRDCQSRNVMLTDRGPVFIDFQGGRKGPALYDAVSLLWQARAGFSSEFRREMLDLYCDAYCGGGADKKRVMLSFLDDIVLFRTLQVLGAYGFRGLVQRKAHFLLSIPGALANLRELIDAGALDFYPELRKCAEKLTAESSKHTTCDQGPLTVEVISFSYKKGYPEDFSGNGGGFVFDCRALHNPGRYQQYKSQTGRDRAVIEFLEERGEIQPFLRNAWSLTDPAIERYLSRGFTRLQIGFGCTGGQHRSVYSAEATARHIRSIFPEVIVRLIHREHPEI